MTSHLESVGFRVWGWVVSVLTDISITLEKVWFGQETIEIWPSKIEGVIEKKKHHGQSSPTLVCKQFFPYQQIQKSLHISNIQYSIMTIFMDCSFSFNGQDAKMYMGLKIYSNTKHGVH